MCSHSIEEFGKKLIENVRDNAVESCDVTLSDNCNDKTSERWKNTAKIASVDELIKVVIPDVVDETIFHLLNSIDTGELCIFFKRDNGELIDLRKEGLGELAGWYLGSEEWREKYSKCRFFDDFAD